MSKTRRNQVRLRCERCHQTLDFYSSAGNGQSYSPGYLKKSMSKGPNGWRLIYTCTGRVDGRLCRAEPVLLLAKLMPLVPEAHRIGKSILTNYQFCC